MSSLLLREIVPTENKLKTDCKNDKWRKEIYKFVGGHENNKIINIVTDIQLWMDNILLYLKVISINNQTRQNFSLSASCNRFETFWWVCAVTSAA